MKKITVAYWRGRDLIPHYKHNSEFDYSVKKRDEIIHMILEHGFSIMVRPNIGDDKNVLIIFIDNGIFRQS